MISLNPAGFILIGITFLYTYLLRIIFFPVTLIASLFQNPSKYMTQQGRGHGLFYFASSIGKIILIAVVTVLIFKRSLLENIPSPYLDVIGIICILSAISELYFVAHGFSKTLIQASIWAFITLCITNAFYPNVYETISDNKITRLFFGGSISSSLGSIGITEPAPLSAKNSPQYSNKAKMEKDSFLKSNSISFDLKRSLNKVLKKLGFAEKTDNGFASAPSFGETKNTLPDAAYYPAKKSTTTNKTIENKYQTIKNAIIEKASQ
ncbi:MAG TPA: hypothetical protein PKA63_06500 [Oligoflexia bacterium]|nr:hypothetical protein [Oligoflexia bacterium]HMP48299.1 hypothetical protein [Oligoflexia bacterium]